MTKGRAHPAFWTLRLAANPRNQLPIKKRQQQENKEGPSLTTREIIDQKKG
jgi:hypothetical protein